MKKILNRKQKAFTVIELIIVLAIITILFLLYITKMDFASNRARLAGVQTDFRSFYIATKAVQQENAMGELCANSAFEAALNKNLDAALQFTSGTCKLNSPYGYSYKMTTKFADDKLEVLFSTQSDKHTTIYYSLSDVGHSTSDTNLTGKIAYGCVLTNDSLTELSKTEAAALAPANTNSDSGGAGSSSSSGSSSTPTEKALSSIAITTPPTKTTYTDGETFDPTGMVVAAVYSNGTYETITGYTVNKAALSGSDSKVTISYNGKSVNQPITVTSEYTPFIIDSTNRVDIGFDNSNYESSTRNLIIPATFTKDGISYKVVSIADRAFYDCNYLESVTIPDTITAIGNEAFCSCSGLHTVNTTDSITSIGEGAFMGSGLKWITIPKNITNIKKNTFYGCVLSSFVIPSNITSIGTYAFGFTSKLSISLNIPDTVTSIDANAFYNVGHIYYHGTATGSPWGANAIN